MPTSTPPFSIAFLSADTAAECLAYQQHLTKDESVSLYRKLWSIVTECKDLPVYPEIDGNPSRIEEHWGRFSDREQAALIAAGEEG
tara:strand:+ start:1052 stop:1309 length:258 start_codon:yes stop_codon:yes gene_type:complete